MASNLLSLIQKRTEGSNLKCTETQQEILVENGLEVNINMSNISTRDRILDKLDE
jgi:hypothetical protein